MGLVVQGSVVKVEHSNKDWLKTTPHGNPTKENIEGLLVYSLFKRLLASRKSRRKYRDKIPGDNCPIIYALKGKDNLTTDITSIKKLRLSYATIVSVFQASEPDGYDLVISMPSAYNISSIIGKRLARTFTAQHSYDFLRKLTIEEAFNLLDRADISVEEHKTLSHRLRKQMNEKGFQGDFSLKGIPVPFRSEFPPLCLNNTGIENLEPKRILLVDDLLATGTTLKTAYNLVESLYPHAVIHGASLISSSTK
ncbi:Phosphoribosyl transferase domain-containing protein [Colwellia chukchiensis]|uniref:Phosphoribosyl transferase domain-containing protein n=1 Tax=Colwellia chukchiensis TaxID=641665 RepID=A0A1H7I1S4_9GAMM|nr:phosphoribosyltransferase [Colwellia chukchiensis]SEK56506.1 Phosphoribosyl transferase domain-containing protein [Colwellia chukchiensis]